MLPGDLEDGEIELQEKRNNNNGKQSASNKGKGNQKYFQQSKQSQQPRGFTGGNGNATKKDERGRESG